MAKQVVVNLIDDLDGSKADGTTSFALNGVTYEVDLSRKNVAALEKALKPYISAGRKAKSGSIKRVSTRSNGGGNHQRLASIRDWAKANGHVVSDRGRIAKSVQEAYAAAH